MDKNDQEQLSSFNALIDKLYEMKKEQSAHYYIRQFYHLKEQLRKEIDTLELRAITEEQRKALSEREAALNAAHKPMENQDGN